MLQISYFVDWLRKKNPSDSNKKYSVTDYFSDNINK